MKKNLKDFTTKQDLQDWKDYFLLVENIPDDQDTKLKRSVAVNGFNIDGQKQAVEMLSVVYNLDVDGNPINGLIDPKRGNIIPRTVLISANNGFYVDLRTPGFKVLTAEEVKPLKYGVDYIEEFEAYRLYAKGNPIDIFALMENSVRQSSLI
jgi:hypothetical protein